MKSTYFRGLEFPQDLLDSFFLRNKLVRDLVKAELQVFVIVDVYSHVWHCVILGHIGSIYALWWLFKALDG